MISVSTTYNNIISGGGHYDWQIINGSNTYDKDELISGDITMTLYEGASVGNTISSQLELSLRDVTVDTSSPLVVKFRANDGTSQSDWYTKGTFFIDTMETSQYSGITKITAFDAMLKAETPYQVSGEWQEITDLIALQRIASDIGVTIDSATETRFANNPRTLTNPPNIGVDGTTEREVLSYIGAMRGANWIIDYTNSLKLININATPSNTANIGDAVVDFDASPAETISKVRVWTGDDTFYAYPGLPLQTHLLEDLETQDNDTILARAASVMSEWEALGGRLIDVSIPFWCSFATGQNLYNQISGKTLYPFVAQSAYVDPKYEVGDGIKVKDVTSVIANQTISLDPLSASDIELKKDDVINSYYPYKSVRQRTNDFNIARNTAQIAANTAQIAQNTVAVMNVPSEIERATTLITGGFGGYVKWTYLPNGTPSELLFMDSPEEATATNILRINRNGIGFSTDGGATYANAWTIDGKLNADFITTGTLDAARIAAGSIAISQLTNGAQAALMTSSSSKTQYYLSTSSSQATGGSWQDAVPTWSSGKYIWTRVATTKTYANGSSETTYDNIDGKYDRAVTTALSDASSAITLADSANDKEQLIYISKPTGTTSVSKKEDAWVTATSGAQNTWTIVRPEYNSSYPVLFVATQRQSVSGTITCTTPQIDKTTTVIDGGNIITGSITAGQIAANSITADKLSVGSGENLYVNYDSFEQVDTDTLYYSKSSNLEATVIASEWARDGSNVMRLGTNSDVSNSYILIGHSSTNYGQIRLDPGKYIFSYYCRPTSGSVEVICAVYGRTVRSSSWSDSSTFSLLNGVTTTFSGVYKRAEVPITVTAEYPFICPRFRVTTANSAVLIDCLQLEPVSDLAQGAGAWHPAGSTIIDGDTIQTGTIDAGVVNVTNINASNITAGTISDASGENYWNLTTGQLVTKQGALGGFTVNNNGLRVGTTGINTEGTTIYPGSILYTDVLPNGTSRYSYLAAGQMLLKVAASGAGSYSDALIINAGLDSDNYAQTQFSVNNNNLGFVLFDPSNTNHTYPVFFYQNTEFNQDVNIIGSLTLGTPLAVDQGGTGGVNAYQARQGLELTCPLLKSGVGTTETTVSTARYAYNAFIVVGVPGTTSKASIYIPKAAITTSYVQWELSNSGGYIEFEIKYSGNNVYVKTHSKTVDVYALRGV